MKEPQFTMGIEEEYLVVDKKTRDLVDDLLEAHGDWLPPWARPARVHRVA